MPSPSPITRRQFVATTAAAAMASPLIIPSVSWGAAGVRRPRPSGRLNLGFIGIGVMNRDHLHRFLDIPEVQVQAVCDIDTTRREAAKKMVDDKYSAAAAAAGCAAYNDYRGLLERKDIDAVAIATPDHWHAIIVIEACKAKKDIYCEKPLSLKIHEAKAMIDAVRKHDRVFQTGSQQRTEYDGKFRTACEYVRSGRIGKVLTVHVGVGGPSKWCDLPEESMEPNLDWDRWLGPAPMRPYNSILSPRGVHNHYPLWRNYREYSGGTMTDMGAHHFDIAQWGLDMDTSGPVEVRPALDGDRTVGVRYVYANGVEMTHGGPSGTTFIGTKGMIQVDRDKLVSIPEGILKEPLGDNDLHLPKFSDHHANWLECVKSRQRCICDVEVGARSVTVCHLGNLVYWNNRALKWDPKNWNFGNDREANGWMDYQRREGYALPEA
jgi:predicted dehydrogenase